MKTVWKWIIGIVAVLLIAALVVGGFFLVHNVLPMHRVVVQTFDQSQGFGQRGFDNRNFGPDGMMPGFGMRDGFGMHGMHGGFGMMGGMMPFGGIFSGLFFLAFLALVVLGIIWLVRRTKTPAPVAVQPAAVMHSCQNCGKPVQDDWKNCPYCGKKLKF
jgi:lipopolysaccharide export system protein LptC